MASWYIICGFLCLLLVNVKCDDLQVGTSVNNTLLHVEAVKVSSVPLKVRTKNIFYNDPNQKIIKGIMVLDLDKSEAKASLTSGGVGATFVNIKLKGKRGKGLNYQIQIYG